MFFFRAPPRVALARVIVGVAAGLWSGWTLAQLSCAAAQPCVVDLQAALQAARNNVEVSLSRRQLQSSQADLLAADRSPLPVFSARASSIDLDRGPRGSAAPTRPSLEKNLGLDWTIERGGKRTLRTESARESAEAAGWQVQDMRIQQQVAAATAFFGLLAAQDKLTELDELVRSSTELASLSLRRQRAGDISQQEALRTEIEAQRTLAERRSVQAERERAAVALTELTGLAGPLLARETWPDAQSGMPLALDLTRRPDVRAAQRRVEAARAALLSAQALRRNDVTVGTGLSQQTGTSRAMLELRLQMPLAGILGNYAYEGEIGRAQAQLDQAGDDLERVRRQAAAELARLSEDLRAASELVQRYDADIVPRARRVAQMSELAYSRGALALVELIDARRTLRSVLLDQLTARADHARALSAWQLRTEPVQP